MWSRKGTLSIAVLVAQLLTAESSQAVEEIEVGNMIDMVISGRDFSGQELVLSGIALNQTGAGKSLLNVGTLATYRSGAYTNFVSVYDTSTRIASGSRVKIRVLVEESSASKLGETFFVIIETVFRGCVACTPP